MIARRVIDAIVSPQSVCPVEILTFLQDLTSSPIYEYIFSTSKRIRSSRRSSYRLERMLLPLLLSKTISLHNQAVLTSIVTRPDLSLLVYRTLNLDLPISSVRILCICGSHARLNRTFVSSHASFHHIAVVVVCVGEIVHVGVGAITASADVRE